MNLNDIAKRAGVSRSTVSRVINGDDYVSEKTRQKVMRVIEEVGFSPNPAARILRTQRTEVIGVVIPRPLSDVFSATDPYYYNAIIQGISEVTQRRGYAMLVWVGNVSESAEQFYQRILKNRLMDGLVIVASVIGEELLVKDLLKNETPFVLLGRPINFADQVSYVTVDNVAAAEEAVKHLFSQGKRRIAHITGDWDNVDSHDRLEGYKRALRAFNIPYDENLVVHGRYDRQTGYSATKLLLAEHDIDAVFAGSDLIGVGVIEAAQEQGLNVPHDLAIVAFDDFPIAAKYNLTTIRQPINRKAVDATTLLIDLIEDKVKPPKQKLLATQLVIRETCGYIVQKE
ncbi:MAG: LacI family DNA-binding transcriptional regulator [Phototrophicales bacterium]